MELLYVVSFIVLFAGWIGTILIAFLATRAVAQCPNCGEYAFGWKGRKSLGVGYTRMNAVGGMGCGATFALFAVLAATAAAIEMRDPVGVSYVLGDVVSNLD